MNTAILLRLLFAHFLSDFILQTDKISNGKKGFYIQNNIREPITCSKSYGYLLMHSATHASISYLLVGEWNNWIIPTVLCITHFIIDRIKLCESKSNAQSFVLDQAAHLLVILLLWGLLFTPCNVTYHWLQQLWISTNVWLLLLGYIIVLKPTSIFLDLFIKRWTPQDSNENMHGTSLPCAGKWIGYLERLLIITFVVFGKFEAIGFLLAAKSVFRYGELRKSHDIKMTEYVLIGTLLSFTIAILVGFLVSKLLSSI